MMPDIGKVARAEHACRLAVLQAGEASLQLGEQGMIAGYQPRRAAADAVAFERCAGGGLERRVMGQVEVIIAAERQEPPPVALRPDSVQTNGLRERAAQVLAFQLAEFSGREFVE